MTLQRPSLSSVMEDPRLRDVVKTTLTNFKCESLYLHGSYSRRQQRPSSDYDLIALAKLPLILTQLGVIRKLPRLKKEHKIDLKIISIEALKRNGGSIRLKNWERDALLLAGKPFLPVSSSLTDFAYAKDIACMGIHLINAIELSSQDVRTNKFRLRSLANYLRQNVMIGGMPKTCETLALRVKEEAGKENADARFLCSLFAAHLSELRPCLKFSLLDQLVYVVTVLLGKKRFLIHTLFKREPIQIRFVDALILLLKSVATSPPDMELLSEAAKKLDDHLGNFALSDPYVAWSRIQELLGKYWDFAARIPFGLFILKKKVILY